MVVQHTVTLCCESGLSGQLYFQLPPVEYQHSILKLASVKAYDHKTYIQSFNDVMVSKDNLYNLKHQVAKVDPCKHRTCLSA